MHTIRLHARIKEIKDIVEMVMLKKAIAKNVMMEIPLQEMVVITNASLFAVEMEMLRDMKIVMTEISLMEMIAQATAASSVGMIRLKEINNVSYQTSIKLINAHNTADGTHVEMVQ